MAKVDVTGSSAAPEAWAFALPYHRSNRPRSIHRTGAAKRAPRRTSGRRIGEGNAHIESIDRLAGVVAGEGLLPLVVPRQHETVDLQTELEAGREPPTRGQPRGAAPGP